MFSHDYVEILNFGKKIEEMGPADMNGSLQQLRVIMAYYADINLDPLVKVVSTWFLHCIVIIFPRVIKQYLRENTLNYTTFYFSLILPINFGLQ